MTESIVDLRCPKCGSGRDTTFTRYVSVNDYLQLTCTICGYEWKKDPADRATQETIPDGDLDVK